MKWRPHIINNDNGYVRTNLPMAEDIGMPYYVYAFGRTHAEKTVKYSDSGKCNIICTESGQGRAFINGEWVSVPVGAAIYYPIHADVWYEPVGEEPWSTVFFTFAGRFAESTLDLGACVIRGDLSFIGATVDALDEKYLTEEWEEYSAAALVFCLHRLRRITGGTRPRNRSDGDTEAKLLASIKYITNTFYKDISLALLAERCDISEQHYCRLFKKYTGTTPAAYIISLRLSHACDLLTKGECKKISAIAAECGFHSTTYFNKVFRREIGMNPAQFRDRNKK